jgi:hypothetical protein
MKKALILLILAAFLIPSCAFTLPESAHINTFDPIEAAVEIPVVVGHSLSSVLSVEPSSVGFKYLPAVFELEQ